MGALFFNENTRLYRGEDNNQGNTMTYMTCCICGDDAGNWAQHHNRDAEYGICPACVAEEAAVHTPEELESLYGVAGINYDRPIVRHQGRKYRVLAATRAQDVANNFMARTPNASVLLVFEDGLIVLVDKDDLGVPLEEMNT